MAFFLSAETFSCMQMWCAMSNPTLFDCWASYGPGPAKDPAARWTLDELLEDMDLYGIRAALVRHEQGLHYDAMFTNRRLSAETARYRARLHPCWTVMPHQTGEFPDPESLTRLLDEAAVGAVLIAPQAHGYPVHGDVLSPLCEMLNQRHCLVLTTLGELGNEYLTAVTFCRLLRDCPVIIAEATWGQWRLVTAILDACPNACLELSAFQANRALEILSARYGSERVLLGTGLPGRSGAAARGFVDWSLADADTVGCFAGGNLARLLGIALPSPMPIPAGADSMVREAREGKPLSCPVLDAHCHVLDDGLNGAGSRYVMPSGDSAGILQLSRRMGIDLTAMMSWSGTVSMDVRAGNALMEKVVERSPDDIIGLSSADPSHQTQDEIQALCEHLHGVKGFRGLKPYTRNDIPYNDKRYRVYWDYANEHRLYVLVHTAPNVGGMAAILDLAARYREVTFLVPHAGGSWRLARQVVEAALEFPNVVAELTYTAAINRIIEWFCGQIGCERVLFGTDAPMRDPRPQLAWCVHTALPVEDKQMIVGGSFARILARAHLPGHRLPAAVRRALLGGSAPG